jgi:hypothetical protein
MRSSLFLSSLVGVAFVAAEPMPDDTPTRVQRDIATVSSVVAQVSGAISQLDTSVKAFSGDATKITSDSAKLLTVLKSGVTTIQGSTELSLTEALGLQSSVTTLQTASDALVSDLGTKKTAFEQAKLCSVVSATVSDVSTSSKSLIDAVVAKVPAAAQSIASSLTAGLQNSLAQGVALFANGNCTDTTTAAGGAGGGPGGGPGKSAAPTITNAAEPTSSKAAGGSGMPMTMSMSRGAGSGGGSGSRGNMTVEPTGGMTSSHPPIATAAAGANAVGQAGLVAGVFAALLL